MNPRACQLLEVSPEKALGRPVEAIVKIQDAHGAAMNALRRAIRENRDVELVERRALHLQGGVRLDVEEIASPLHDGNGNVVGGVLVIRDVSVAQALADHMRHLAMHDPLTGLPNRAHLMEQLKQSVARAKRDAAHVAVLYMDLDGFKHVNDTLGHDAGDALLREVSERLSKAIRESDSIFRIGGDEFVVIAYGMAGDIALDQLCHRLMQAASAPFIWRGQRVLVSLSIGGSIYPEDGPDVDQLLRHADDALYRAKRGGKNRWVIGVTHYADSSSLGPARPH